MADQAALSVSQAMALAKRALEDVRVTVIGEVSEFNDRPGYKAAYFTIGDDTASMPCLMWRDAYIASGIQLRAGMLVEITGQFSAYAAKGRMQFVVRRLEMAGEGRLRLQVAELARRLETEGLMRPERKRGLPVHPLRIGVVTSPRGKAVHDVLRTLKRRYPLAEVLVAGVTVEGAAASDAIVEGLRTAAGAGVDVVLLVRGGGSYEDLMPFNSEAVARAVASCSVPVVTGIGHEPDTCIADLVADRRCSTPTAAAEAAAPAIEDLQRVMDRVRGRLGRALQHGIDRSAHRVERLASRPLFTDPGTLLGGFAQAVDSADMRLGRAIPTQLQRTADRVAFARGRLLSVGGRLTQKAAGEVALMAARLDDLSPLAILRRGYAAVFAEDGHSVVSRVTQVQKGDCISVRVSDGRFACTVDEIERGSHE